MTRGAIWLTASAVLAVGVVGPAMARPPYLQAFKTFHKTAQGKTALNAGNCAICHMGPPAQAKWNVYGEAVRAELKGAKMVPQPQILAALEAAAKKQNPATKLTFGAMIDRDIQPSATAVGGTGSLPPGATIRSFGNVAWEPVFNNVNMTGLHKMNQGNWTIQEGVLKYTGGGNGWLRSDKQYTNYSSVLVWRYTEAGANDSGFFLKAGMEGNPWPSSPQLNMGPGDNFGSIGGTQGTRARADLIRPVGQWNTYAITVYNGVATLTINGQTAWEKATGLPTGPGYLGIQAENRPFEVAQWWVAPL
jgi:hypothetical protein